MFWCGWWTAFGDSTLTTLVGTALAGDFDLQAAEARVEELSAQFRVVWAPLFPSINANGQDNYQNQPANTGIGGAIGGGGEKADPQTEGGTACPYRSPSSSSFRIGSRSAPTRPRWVCRTNSTSGGGCEASARRP